jgi:signal transduction histidine kinase
MALALSIAVAVLIVLLRASLTRHVDDRAQQRLQDIATLAKHGDLPTTLAGIDEDGTVAQVVIGGHVVAQSPIVVGSSQLAAFEPEQNRVTIRTVARPPIVAAAATYRVAATAVDTPKGLAFVYVAASTEPVSDSMHIVEVVLAVAAPALVGCVATMSWVLVGRTLRPIESIRRQVAEISSTDLDRRVPEPGTRDEIQRLAETMNSMLERLESSTARQRAFVSDAAHELRSPLAAIRTELDVATTHLDSADLPRVIERVSSTTDRLERLTEDLLVLATNDERRVRQETEVDLDDIVLHQLKPLRAEGRLRIDLAGFHPVRVVGDREQLGRLVANVIDNAARHASSTVSVELERDDQRVRLAIGDDGPGIPFEHRIRVFERFTRVDDARNRNDGGAGLGLAIVREIVEDHNGTVAALPGQPGTRVVIELPIHDR